MDGQIKITTQLEMENQNKVAENSAIQDELKKHFIEMEHQKKELAKKEAEVDTPYYCK